MYGGQSGVTRCPGTSVRDKAVRAINDTVANQVSFDRPTPRIRLPHERQLGEAASDG